MDLYTRVFKLFPKINTEGTLPNLFYVATVTLIPKPHKDSTSLGEIRETRNIPKQNKSDRLQVDSRHQIKWRETQSNSTKIRNKTRLFTLPISILYSIQCSS